MRKWRKVKVWKWRGFTSGRRRGETRRLVRRKENRQEDLRK